MQRAETSGPLRLSGTTHSLPRSLSLLSLALSPLRHSGTIHSLPPSLSLSLSLARSDSLYCSRSRSRSVALSPVMLVQGMVRAKLLTDLLAYFLLTRQSLVTF